MTRDEDGFIILKRKYSELYEKTNYRAPIEYCINRIYEYDIKAANVSTLMQKGYIPENIAKTLLQQPKEIREKAIGLMIKEQKELTGSSKLYKIISKRIYRAKERLFSENGIQDDEVLSIKNDAIFVIGRKLRVTSFGGVEFVLKNSFSAYHLINGIEFYYDKKSGKFTVKGIQDEVIETPDHEAGMLKFLEKVLTYLLYDRRDDLRSYLIKFSDQYKSRKLPHQYYRELNSENIYRNKLTISYKEGTNMTKSISFNYEDINDDMIDELNITFNYLFYILPLIRLHL